MKKILTGMIVVSEIEMGGGGGGHHTFNFSSHRQPTVVALSLIYSHIPIYSWQVSIINSVL